MQNKPTASEFFKIRSTTIFHHSYDVLFKCLSDTKHTADVVAKKLDLALIGPTCGCNRSSNAIQQTPDANFCQWPSTEAFFWPIGQKAYCHEVASHDRETLFPQGVSKLANAQLWPQNFSLSPQQSASLVLEARCTCILYPASSPLFQWF